MIGHNWNIIWDIIWYKYIYIYMSYIVIIYIYIHTIVMYYEPSRLINPGIQNGGMEPWQTAKIHVTSPAPGSVLCG